jgi:uncharacterized protein with PIN domain
MNVESGKCPRCNTTIEDYGTQELLDMTVYYPFTCKKCGFEGREWYDLTFTGFTDTQGNEMEDKTIGVYKENTRVELKQDVERYPHFIAKKGMKGTVIRNDDDEIAVKLDEKLIGSEEWENCVVWYKQDFNTGRDFSEEVSNDLMVIE